jgi:DnaJ-class molecular chaperone
MERRAIVTEDIEEEEEEIECDVCGGYGEFPNNSYSTQWAKCEACNGTGIRLNH